MIIISSYDPQIGDANGTCKKQTKKEIRMVGKATAMMTGRRRRWKRKWW